MDIFESIFVDESLQPIFTEHKICREDIDIILENAARAPSPYNSQPWEFLILQDQKHIRQIAPLVAEAVDCSHIDMHQGQVTTYLSHLHNVLFYLEDTTRQDPGVNAFTLGLICMGTALANFILAASAKGIGLQPLIFQYSRENIISNLKKSLKIPDKFALRCLFGFGYLQDRKAFAREGETAPLVVHENHYGNRKETAELKSTLPDQDRFLLFKKRASYRKNFLKQDTSRENEENIIKAAGDCYIFKKQRYWDLIIIKDKTLINAVADLITETASEIHIDEGYSKKMRAWTRFTLEEKAKTTDGVLLIFWSNILGYLLKGVTYCLERFAIFRPLRVFFVRTHSKEFFGNLVRQAPLLIVVTYNKRKLENSNLTYEQNTISVGMGIQHMLLAATAQNMGVQFLSILADSKKARRRVKELLHLPDDVRVIDLMRMGYIDPAAKDPLLKVGATLRRPVDKIAHLEFYNSPLTPSCIQNETLM